MWTHSTQKNTASTTCDDVTHVMSAHNSFRRLNRLFVAVHAHIVFCGLVRSVQRWNHGTHHGATYEDAQTYIRACSPIHNSEQSCMCSHETSIQTIYDSEAGLEIHVHIRSHSGSHSCKPSNALDFLEANVGKLQVHYTCV